MRRTALFLREAAEHKFYGVFEFTMWRTNIMLLTVKYVRYSVSYVAVLPTRYTELTDSASTERLACVYCRGSPIQVFLRNCSVGPVQRCESLSSPHKTWDKHLRKSGVLSQGDRSIWPHLPQGDARRSSQLQGQRQYCARSRSSDLQ